ncbi:MAG: ketoacyl-ACP synthase III [Chloroflexi bacterium]|nr:ketoacyl-ACP synthase III [Chloroflexota bacterium]
MGAYAEIVGWGKYVPSRVLSNEEFQKIVDTSDEWIRTRTGISERRLAGPKDTASSMAIKAALQALEVADVSPSKIDLVIAATSTPDYIFPATASLVQDAIGASNAGAMDVNAACSGFVYALSVANSFITSGMHQHVLVIGTDTLSRLLDYQDRSTCVLFGDGAGAVILQKTQRPTGMLSFVLGSDGSGVDLLHVPGVGGSNPATPENIQPRPHFIKMNGNEVFRFAVGAIVKASTQAIRAAGLTVEDIELFIPHQANARIIQSAAKSLKLPPERVFVNVDRYGNTSSASVAIALCEAIEQGRIHEGDHLVLVAFGGGLSWAAVVMQWGGPAMMPEVPWWKSAVHHLRGREAAAKSLAKRTARKIRR